MFGPRFQLRCMICHCICKQIFENRNGVLLYVLGFIDWLFGNVQIMYAFVYKLQGSCEQKELWQNCWKDTDPEKKMYVHFIYRLFVMIEQWNRLSSLSPIFVNFSLGNPKVGYSIQQREMNKGAKSMTSSNRQKICTMRWNGKRKLGVSTVISKNSSIMLKPHF